MSVKSYLDNPFALGFLRASLMFPLDHVIDMTKLTAQKSPELSSWKVIGDIYKNNGLKGFANGALPNFPRRVLRDSVRWPVVGYSYHFLTSRFPETFPEKSTTASVFSGLAAATFDALVLGPFELLMSYKIKEGTGYTTFFQKRFSQDGLSSLYRGASFHLFYRSITWTIYTGVDSEVKKQFTRVDKEKLFPYAQEITSAITTATALVTLAMPLDFIKSQIFMQTRLQGKKISFVVQTLLKEHRRSQFYAGAPIAWTYNVFYVLVFQKIREKTIESLKKP